MIHVVLSCSKPTPLPVSNVRHAAHHGVENDVDFLYVHLIIHTHGHYACTLPHPADQSFVNTVEKLMDVQSQFVIVALCMLTNDLLHDRNYVYNVSE